MLTKAAAGRRVGYDDWVHRCSETQGLKRTARQAAQLAGLLSAALVVGGCETSHAAPKRSNFQARIGAPISAPASSVAEKQPAAACGAGMVLVGSFCIDAYEAHLVLASDPSRVHDPTLPLSEGEQYLARSLAHVLPQGYISRDQAKAACEAAGKRLCSAVEWQTACKGKAGYKYPYGRDEEKGRCNTGKLHLPSILFGADVRLGEPQLNSPRLNREPGFLAKTGEYARCVSDYGAYDMMGNLHEWVADDVNSALPKKIPIPYGVQNMGQRNNGVFMGGYYSSHREHGRGCEYVTTHHAPGYHDYSTGFRCCADAGSKVVE